MRQLILSHLQILIRSDTVLQAENALATFDQLSLGNVELALELGVLRDQLRDGMALRSAISRLGFGHT